MSFKLEIQKRILKPGNTHAVGFTVTEDDPESYDSDDALGAVDENMFVVNAETLDLVRVCNAWDVANLPTESEWTDGESSSESSSMFRTNEVVLFLRSDAVLEEVINRIRTDLKKLLSLYDTSKIEETFLS
jgi:hypothetical protein